MRKYFAFVLRVRKKLAPFASSLSRYPPMTVSPLMQISPTIGYASERGSALPFSSTILMLTIGTPTVPGCAAGS